MNVISNLGLGFAVALTIQNIAYCFIGVLLGTIIGVLPGIGPVTTVAMLLPISFTLQPESALIMLAGIYYGSQYGGSTTPLLVNLPGEGASVVTTLHGYQMAPQGRAGGAPPPPAIGALFPGTPPPLLVAPFRPPPPAPGRPFSDRRVRPAARGAGAPVRARRVLLAHGGRAGRIRRPRAGVAAARDRHGRVRALIGPGRDGRHVRHPAVHVRDPAARGRDR